jgi:3D (Asp-Asp-Asp) domain-containing protein
MISGRPGGVVYSPGTMTLIAFVRTAGSRMIGSGVKISLLSVGCGVLLALLGAVKPQASVNTKLRVEQAPELLKDATAPAVQDSASQASAVLPAAGQQKKFVWVLVTAYCGCSKCCGANARGLTASGRSVSYNGGRFVAADTRIFKFDTQLVIPGYAGGEPVEVIDRGGAIKGNHLDVFFPTHEEAKAWGKRWLPVTVVE